MMNGTESIGSYRKKIAASSILVLLAAVVFASCMRNTEQELQQIEAEQERSSLTVFDLHTVVTDTGFYRYEFESPELHQYDNLEEPIVDFPHGLRFKMFVNRGETVRMRIRCNNAKYFKQRNLWELNNDVEAINEKGNTLNTEQLYWNSDEKKIYSDKFVKITTESQVITGVGFESDDAMTKYEIKNPGGEIEIENTKNE